ncbi:hypothetical protein BC830DRAFT_242668 [Chytriomyces sp. MP71]|nr:hypothetical protein BC830DRAFT_242668 [Chytriomyces sp. MP71]
MHTNQISAFEFQARIKEVNASLLKLQHRLYRPHLMPLFRTFLMVIFVFLSIALLLLNNERAVTITAWSLGLLLFILGIWFSRRFCGAYESYMSTKLSEFNKLDECIQLKWTSEPSTREVMSDVPIFSWNWNAARSARIPYKIVISRVRETGEMDDALPFLPAYSSECVVDLVRVPSYRSTLVPHDIS